MTAPTPCRGRSAVYDAATSGQVRAERRQQAQTIAAALCSRCPIASTCPARITAPIRKASTMPDTAPTPHPVPQLVHPTAPTTDQPTTADALIAWGAAHTSSRVQALAGRARAALADLRQTADRESKVTAAEARIQRLKAQLANAEKDLRAAKGTPPPKASGAKAGPTEDYAAIRAWAREHGVEVGAVGRPARAVIEAYHTAHPGQQSNAVA